MLLLIASLKSKSPFGQSQEVEVAFKFLIYFIYKSTYIARSNHINVISTYFRNQSEITSYKRQVAAHCRETYVEGMGKHCNHWGKWVNVAFI